MEGLLETMRGNGRMDRPGGLSESFTPVDYQRMSRRMSESRSSLNITSVLHPQVAHSPCASSSSSHPPAGDEDVQMSA